ncbi:MAG: hypothetical protein IPK19_21785, partial [Chloroflexi bacterium]|nr:hypothetical protein [Chloroflexota bacterium]
MHRYYDWLLTDVDPRAYRMGAFESENENEEREDAGIQFCRPLQWRVSEILDRNRNFLIAKVATRPWLLLSLGCSGHASRLPCAFSA